MNDSVVVMMETDGTDETAISADGQGAAASFAGNEREEHHADQRRCFARFARTG